ncbi:MAG: UbiA family prenyltransferase [Pseudomonadota bacterium]
MNVHNSISDDISLVFVDLDGTLLVSDTLFEAAFAYVRAHPLHAWKLLLWLFAGRSVLKSQLARHAPLDIASLPVRTDLLRHLHALKSDGAELVLATAAHWKIAQRFAHNLDLFDDVLASSARHNLKGKAKLAAIQAYAQGQPFAYAGDSPADRAIWQAAAGTIFADAPAQDIRAAEKAGKPVQSFSRSRSTARAFLKGMRLHQWAKNALVFVPLLTAHAYGDPAAVLAAILAFLSFGLVASGTYFSNDLLDLSADRKHPTKCKRPLAAGDLPIVSGIIGAVALPLGGFALAIATLPPLFVALLLGYLVLTSAYSLALKRVSTADVMTLAALFTLRLMAGAAAIAVALSFWLFAFSVFVFVSLAYLKRYVELAQNAASAVPPPHMAEGSEENMPMTERIGGRNYWASDAETTFSLGTANATAAVVVLALFVNTPEVAAQYQTPQALWMLCFLMLYWTNRLWVGARRGKINDDPVLFALKDRVSQIIGLAFAATLVFARYVSL